MSSSYPEQLIKKAVERTVDATDPRVRILGHYGKQLRPAVLHAMDHVIGLVDALAAPIPMTPANHATALSLNVMFSSGDSLLDCLRWDVALRDFLSAEGVTEGSVFALLMAKPSRRHIFGHDLIEGKMMSDVPLTVISFDDHRLVGLARDEVETRRILKWRAFDYILVTALNAVTEAQTLRTGLKSRKQLLKAKLDILNRSSGKPLQGPLGPEKQKIQERMAQVEAELSDIGAEDTVLHQHLELIGRTLLASDQHLFCNPETLYIDPMQYLRDASHPKARAVPVQLLHDAQGAQWAIQLVSIPTDCIAELR
ncbi:hypothetical protein [Ketobacter sp.]|uniref:hypothetical protein n=1 Tax=Ketobacter sp. TaxID=2083498 RepID=UPI0025BF3DA8|nr:hypothetical protein [Ketobacter sp.]